MKVLFLGAFAVSQAGWIRPVIERGVDMELVAENGDREARRRGADAARNIDRFVRGEKLQNVVATT